MKLRNAKRTHISLEEMVQHAKVKWFIRGKMSCNYSVLVHARVGEEICDGWFVLLDS